MFRKMGKKSFIKAGILILISLCVVIFLNMSGVFSQELQELELELDNHTKILYLDIYIDKSGKALVMGYVDNDSLAHLDFLKDSEYSFDEDENQIYAITSFLTYKFKEIWEVNISQDCQFSEYDITIHLPEDSAITNISCSSDLSYEIYSKQGYLAVEFFGFDVYAPNVCVYYKYNYKEVLNYNSYKYEYEVLLSIFFLIVFVVMFLLTKGKKTKETKKYEITPEMKKVIDTLSEREKKIVNALIKSGGKLKQNKLRIETGIPKSSLTMILRSLEKKKIINKRKYGKTNIIELSEWFISGNERSSK